MRYLLDTNIVIFMISEDLKNMTSQTKEITKGYENILYISAMSLVELKYLFENNKLRKITHKTTKELFDYISENLNLEVLHTKNEHFKTYSELTIVEGKTDLIDRFIISQAICEGLTLISSDKAFENYTGRKLKFIFNKR
ncbi:MAG: PIN domain-containing protein [Capnocytophaga sp.]|nr:PIN domain-containing protein [Capnocytophaga sp.]